MLKSRRLLKKAGGLFQHEHSVCVRHATMRKSQSRWAIVHDYLENHFT